MIRRPYTFWTDEDRAYAIAQWCSGFTQKQIAQHFHSSGAPIICEQIRKFIEYWDADNNGKFPGYGMAAHEAKMERGRDALRAFLAWRQKWSLTPHSSPLSSVLPATLFNVGGCSDGM